MEEECAVCDVCTGCCLPFGRPFISAALSVSRHSACLVVRLF